MNNQKTTALRPSKSEITASGQTTPKPKARTPEQRRLLQDATMRLLMTKCRYSRDDAADAFAEPIERAKVLKMLSKSEAE
jgi:hypothetical protein